jgi:lipopolysaccharide biosynthesis protein
MDKNPPAAGHDVRLIALYLPQFHPIPENDLWWGKGFTEWTNVAKARPLFNQHYQPHLPADLGFYDLRLAEAREAQAELAREHRIFGFCYYHYWFNGRRLLERPLNEVLASGKPQFPFCVCWANESWSRRWDGGDKEILVRQEHSLEDDKAFIESLLPVFKDERYIRVHGRPLLFVYRTDLFPDPRKTVEVWREAARRAAIGELYLVKLESFSNAGDPETVGFDASVEFPVHQIPVEIQYDVKHENPEFQARLFDYQRYVDLMMARPAPAYKRFKGIFPSWDNTARMAGRASLFINSSPAKYREWLSHAIQQTKSTFEGDERIVVINAWNEWGEGCHLEPDQKFGLAYLQATRAAFDAPENRS